VVFVVSVAVLAAARGVSVGKGERVVLHVASRPQQTQVDNRAVAGGVKARELD
jgi:hypothetical protein